MRRREELAATLTRRRHDSGRDGQERGRRLGDEVLAPCRGAGHFPLLSVPCVAQASVLFVALVPDITTLGVG